MAAATLVIIFALISATKSQECPAERADPIRSYDAQIHELITSRECSTEHPLVLDPTRILKIKVHFFLKYYEFDPAEEVFSIHSWVALIWNNPYLTWNPEEYGGIGDILVHSMDIWTPSLEHLDAVDNFPGKDLFSVLCSVFSDGKVVCIPRVRHDVICSSKLSNWPYDTQVCQLKFGTTDTLGPKMNFTFDTTKAVTVGGAEMSAGWFIKSYKYSESAVNSSRGSNILTIGFEIQRTAEDIAVMFVTPAFALSVITVASLLLSVTENVRLGLLCFNLLNHFYLLQDIVACLPKHSADTPTILSLVCGLMVINVFSLILTIVFSKICIRETAPKLSFASKIVEFMEHGVGKYINVTKWETVEDSDSKIKYNKEWLGLCNFVNCICLVGIMIVYLLLFICYVPAKFRSF